MDILDIIKFKIHKRQQYETIYFNDAPITDIKPIGIKESIRWSEEQRNREQSEINAPRFEPYTSYFNSDGLTDIINENGLLGVISSERRNYDTSITTHENLSDTINNLRRRLEQLEGFSDRL